MKTWWSVDCSSKEVEELLQSYSRGNKWETYIGHGSQRRRILKLRCGRVEVNSNKI